MICCFHTDPECVVVLKLLALEVAFLVVNYKLKLMQDLNVSGTVLAVISIVRCLLLCTSGAIPPCLYTTPLICINLPQ